MNEFLLRTIIFVIQCSFIGFWLLMGWYLGYYGLFRRRAKSSRVTASMATALLLGVLAYGLYYLPLYITVSR